MKNVPLFESEVNEGRGIDAYTKIPNGDFKGILHNTPIWCVWVFTSGEGQYKSMSNGADKLADLMNIVIGSTKTSGATDSWLAGIFTDEAEAKKLYDAIPLREEK